MTKAIKELETELEAPLLTRSPQGIEVTECGVHLTVRAQLAQAQLSLARQDIRQLLSGAQARVAVGVTPMVMLSVLPDVLNDFRQSMPAAKLKVSEGLLAAVLPALRNGSLDFALASGMAGNHGGQEFDFEELRPLEFMVACRRGHPLAGARVGKTSRAANGCSTPRAAATPTLFCKACAQTACNRPNASSIAIRSA